MQAKQHPSSEGPRTAALGRLWHTWCGLVDSRSCHAPERLSSSTGHLPRPRRRSDNAYGRSAPGLRGRPRSRAVGRLPRRAATGTEQGRPRARATRRRGDRSQHRFRAIVERPQRTIQAEVRRRGVDALTEELMSPPQRDFSRVISVPAAIASARTDPRPSGSGRSAKAVRARCCTARMCVRSAGPGACSRERVDRPGQRNRPGRQPRLLPGRRAPLGIDAAIDRPTATTTPTRGTRPVTAERARDRQRDLRRQPLWYQEVVSET